MLPLNLKNYYSDNTSNEAESQKISRNRADDLASLFDSEDNVINANAEEEYYVRNSDVASEKRTITKKSSLSDYGYTRPSSTELRLVDADEDLRAESSVQSKVHVKLNAKLKAMIAIYALVILTLAVIIVLNVTLLSRINRENSSLQTQINTVSGEISTLSEELNSQGQDSIYNDAVDKYGMSKDAGTVVNFEPAPIVEKSSEQMPKNWFDRLCDFFSGN